MSVEKLDVRTETRRVAHWTVKDKPALGNTMGTKFFPRTVTAVWIRHMAGHPWLRPDSVVIRGPLVGSKGQPLKHETRRTFLCGAPGPYWPDWVRELIHEFDPDKEPDTKEGS